MHVREGNSDSTLTQKKYSRLIEAGVSSFIGNLVGLLVTLAISGAIIANFLNNGVGSVVLGFILGFILLFMLAWARACLLVLLQLRKFGRARLELLTPPQLGTTINARLMLSHSFKDMAQVQVTCQCKKLIVRNKGRKNASTEESIFWTHSLETTLSNSQLQFSLSLPATLPPSSTEQPLDQPWYEWHILVRSAMAGVDFDKTYTIEVTAAENAQPWQEPPEPQIAGVQPDAVFATAGLHDSDIAGNTAVSKVPGAALIIANLVPLFGVLFWNWELRDLVMIYWLENLVIGVMNLLRIASCSPTDAQQATNLSLPVKLFMLVFFSFHYGMFCFVHGQFLLFMFYEDHTGFSGIAPFIDIVMAQPQLLQALAALFISHFLSYLLNYLGRGEHRNTHPTKLMSQPYGRIVVVHIFILGAGFLTMAFNATDFALALFIILKIAVDLNSHRSEHRKAGTARTA